MKRNLPSDHPLRNYFAEAVHESFSNRLGFSEEDVEAYVTDLLVQFLHRDTIFAIRDNAGRRLESIAEMAAEGDVLLNANSFERERQVHKHLGDFLLFWSGLFPEYLDRLAEGQAIDPVEQGQYSYHVVSTFDHDPYELEALTFRKLSEDFEACRIGLTMVRASFEGFALQGWPHGFEA